METSEEDPPSLSPLSDVLELSEEDVTDSEDFSAFERRINAEEEKLQHQEGGEQTDSEDFSAFERKMEEQQKRELAEQKSGNCDLSEYDDRITNSDHIEPSDGEDFSAFERKIAREGSELDRSEGAMECSTTSGIEVYEMSGDIDPERVGYHNLADQKEYFRSEDRSSAEPTEEDLLHLEHVMTCDEVLSDTRSGSGTPRPPSRDPVLDQFFLDMDTFLEEEELISPSSISSDDNEEQDVYPAKERGSKSAEDQSGVTRSFSDPEYKPEDVKGLLEDLTGLQGYKHEERVLKIIEKLTYCMGYLVDLNKQVKEEGYPSNRQFHNRRSRNDRDSFGGECKTSSSDDEFYLVQNSRAPSRRRSASAQSYQRGLISPDPNTALEDPNAALEDQIKACLTNATSLEMLLTGPGPVTKNRDLSKSLPNIRTQGREGVDLSPIESLSSSSSSLQEPKLEHGSGEVHWDRVPGDLNTAGLSDNLRPERISNSDDNSTQVINDDETGRRANAKLKEVMRIKRELEECVKLSISLEDLIVDYAEKNEIPNKTLKSNSALSVSMPDVRMKNSITDLSRNQVKNFRWASEELPRIKKYRKRFPQENNYTSSDSYYQSSPLGRKHRSRLSSISRDSISSSSMSDGETYRRNVHKLDYPKHLVPSSPLGMEASSKLVRFRKLTTPITSSSSSESLPQIVLSISESTRSSLISPLCGPPIPVETPSYSSQDISLGSNHVEEITEDHSTAGAQKQIVGYSQDNPNPEDRPHLLHRGRDYAMMEEATDSVNTQGTSDRKDNITISTDSTEIIKAGSRVMMVEMAVSPIEELKQTTLQRLPTIEYINRATSPLVEESTEILEECNNIETETRVVNFTSSYSQTDSRDTKTGDMEAQYQIKSSHNSTLETTSGTIPSKDSESQTIPMIRPSKGTSTKPASEVNTITPSSKPVKTLSKNSISLSSEKVLDMATQTVSSDMSLSNLRDIYKYTRPAVKKKPRNKPGDSGTNHSKNQQPVLFCKKHTKSSPHRPTKTTYNVNQRRRKADKKHANIQYNTVTYHVNQDTQGKDLRMRMSSSTSNNKTGDEGDSTLNFSTNFFTQSPEMREDHVRGRRNHVGGGDDDVVSSILLVPNTPDPLTGGEIWEKISEGNKNSSNSSSCDYGDTTTECSLMDRKYQLLLRRLSKNTAQEKRMLLNLFEDLGVSEKRCARLLSTIRCPGPIP